MKTRTNNTRITSSWLYDWEIKAAFEEVMEQAKQIQYRTLEEFDKKIILF